MTDLAGMGYHEYMAWLAAPCPMCDGAGWFCDILSEIAMPCYSCNGNGKENP